MATVRYRYNPETLSFDKLEFSFKMFLKKACLFVGSSLAVGAMLYMIICSSVVTTPKEIILNREIDRMVFNYKLLAQKMVKVDHILGDIQQRDDNIYRTVFEKDPVPMSVRQAGFGGVNRYEPLEGYDHSNLMISTTRKIDRLIKQIYVQSKSYDELVECVHNQEQMLAARPAIQPIDNKDLKHTASGFGMRFHPIRHIWRMHNGMDFTAPKGTDVYVTGNGKVENVGYSGDFGNRIVIDHGFGYKTVYGHLSRFNVNAGDVVKRGQVIGFVGSTGLSTAPHLHYEVHKNGKVVNPINYYYEDLSPEEYELILSLANSGKMYD